jgi:hypothetical protein
VKPAAAMGLTSGYVQVSDAGSERALDALGRPRLKSAKARNRYHRRAWKGLLRVVVYATRLLRKVTWSHMECAGGRV